ncbi:MAG: HEAT repeat domain-containing protein [Pseudomonadota bacterium]
MKDPVRTLLEQYGAFDPQSQSHWVLLILTDSILLLLLLTMLFALFAIVLRLQYNRHQRYWATLHRKWDTDVLDVLSGDQNPNDFRMLVERGQELDFVRFLAPYAYRLRGSDLAILAQLAQKYLPFVVPKLEHKSPGVRVWATNVLSLFGMPAQEETIARMLSDKSPAVAMFAASTLLSHQRLQFIDPILNQFHRFEKWNISALANLLVSIGPSAVPMLEQVYLDTSRPVRTRVVVAEALSRCNAYSAVNAALLVLGSEDDQDILIATLRLIGNICQGRHLESVKALCSSRVDVLRINAMRTLRQIGMQEDLPVFLAAMNDSNPWVVRHAALALCDLGGRASLQAIADDEQHTRSALARQILAETK